ncbi:MAG: S1 family peptidase [Oscillospiraceae bacterium]|nr:S1 family peptidase [Oscillospiraceae bacterium]
MKKMLSILLVIVMLSISSIAVYANDYLDEDLQNDVFAIEAQLPDDEASLSAAITPSVGSMAPPNPETVLVESLDQTTFATSYWDGDVFRITPVPGRRDEVVAAVTMAQMARNNNLPQIVVDIETRLGTVYSMAEREAAYEYLLENDVALNIQGVGFQVEGLAVFMNEGATEADKAAVLEASPISSLKFYDAIVLNSPSDQLNSAHRSELQNIEPRASAVSIRAGNWLRRTSAQNWSTVTVPAVFMHGTSSELWGILTVGHGWRNGQSVFATSGQSIGTARVTLRPNLDINFVPLSPNNMHLYPGNTLRNGGTFTRWQPLASTDLRREITSHGANSGTRNGRIETVRITVTFNFEEGSLRFDNVTHTNIGVITGDSGGPVLFRNTTTVVGLIIGGWGDGPSFFLPLEHVFGANAGTNLRLAI